MLKEYLFNVYKMRYHLVYYSFSFIICLIGHVISNYPIVFYSLLPLFVSLFFISLQLGRICLIENI